MKSEAEVRKFLEDLKSAKVAPCDCGAPPGQGLHTLECRQADVTYAILIDVLTWVVHGNYDYDCFAETIAELAGMLRS